MVAQNTADSTLVTSDLTLEEEAGDSTDNAFPFVHPDSLSAMSVYRGDSMVVRKFDSVAWKRIVGETNYEQKPPEERPTEQPEFRFPWDAVWLKVVSYMVVMVLVVLVVYYLISTTRVTKSVKKTDKPSTPELPIEHIETFDMQQLVDEALRDGQLALAIRYYYLGLLKKLNAAGKIAWKKDKTNIEYLGELLAAGYHYKEIRSLTLAYETIWYGERLISQPRFDQLVSAFQSMHYKIGEAPSDEK